VTTAVAGSQQGPAPFRGSESNTVLCCRLTFEGSQGPRVHPRPRPRRPMHLVSENIYICVGRYHWELPNPRVEALDAHGCWLRGCQHTPTPTPLPTDNCPGAGVPAPSPARLPHKPVHRYQLHALHAIRRPVGAVLRRPRCRFVELPPGAYKISGPGRTVHFRVPRLSTPFWC
jgi:hypothetical protein